jgi:SpoVK/Ycf46/Vps4 family AAA+-type ATPase
VGEKLSLKKGTLNKVKDKPADLQAYQNSLEHLFDELLLIDLIIHARVLRFRAEHQMSMEDSQMQGLYISETEIDELLQGHWDNYDWTARENSDVPLADKIEDSIAQLRQTIDQKVASALEQGIGLTLIHLSGLYQLSSFERQVLALALAPQFHTKYRKFFAYLQNDITRKDLGIELILQLISPTLQDQVSARRFFSVQSSLFSRHILSIIGETRDKERPLIARSVKVNERIVNYILGHDFVDDDLREFCTLTYGEEKLEQSVLQPQIKKRLTDFVNYYQQIDLSEPFLFCLSGQDQSLKKSLASAVCAELNLPLLSIDLQALYYSDLYFERGIELVLRESHLIPCALYFYNTDFLLADKPEDSYVRRVFLQELNQASLLSFLSSENNYFLIGELPRQRVVPLELDIPHYPDRLQLWQKHLEGAALADNLDISEIAGKYQLTAGQIRDITATASTFALWRDPQGPLISQEDIGEASHIFSNKGLNQLTERIKPRYRLSDIVLEETNKTKLQELIDMFRHQHVVMSDWGFDRKLARGKGISAMFSGEPGTGKTMSAEVIAHELGMELYKIDISTVVSKYIGETEKNLKQIFDQAQCSNAVLFFDEADALFGKRTEVKDSHDRYANIEVSYLLQKIEEFNGVVIMATNFSQNLDSAFTRRLHAVVTFQPPDKDDRREIWKRVFPEETPLAEDVDFELLADQLDISGGYIKNIALTAAFYGANSGEGRVSMGHIIQASQREFDKMGRLWDHSYFPIRTGQ